MLAQLVHAGTPVVFGCSHNMTDLRYSSYAIGAPETALMALSAREIGNFYKVPVRTSGTLTDAKTLDYQAGVESFMSNFSSKLAKSDFILFSLGVLDSFNSISYEKFILDEELVYTVNRYLRGYKINEETMSYDKIAKVGPGGLYLARTQKTYREDYYLPSLAIRDSHNNWIENGCETTEDRAYKVCQSRIETYQKPSLAKKQLEIINASMPKELSVL